MHIQIFRSRVIGERHWKYVRDVLTQSLQHLHVHREINMMFLFATRKLDAALSCVERRALQRCSSQERRMIISMARSGVRNELPANMLCWDTCASYWINKSHLINFNILLSILYHNCISILIYPCFKSIHLVWTALYLTWQTFLII